MGGDLDGNARPGERRAGDDALGPRAGGDAGDARHRPEKVDQVGDIVGPMSSIGPPPAR